MSDSNPSELSAEETTQILTLHRYYTWSTILHGHFEDTLSKVAARGERFAFQTDDGLRAFAEMSYWYLALYVVAEGWRKVGLHDEKIDGLLSSPNTELLRRYRHNVAHFHEDYFNRPLSRFAESPDTVQWVRELSGEFGRWFLDHFRVNRTPG